MDDIKSYLYIIGIAGYYIYRYLQKRKKRLESAIPSPTVIQTQVEPHKSPLEELFREYKPKQEEFQSTDQSKPFEHHEIFEDSEIEAQENAFKPRAYTKVVENTPAKEKSLFKHEAIKPKTKIDLNKMLKSKSDIRKAFLLSEVLKPKF